MAGADYICCEECGKRIFYDGDYQMRDILHASDTNGIICAACVKKLKKKIEKLKKYDKRKH